ncbi:MAG: sugar transferase [bacterium]|nr:sugar transferase [bacterium]
MLKRTLDILCSLLGLCLLSPLFIIVAILVGFTSKGGVFFVQKRVGLNNHDFDLLKFRTMFVESEKNGLLTIGGKDPRITSIGYFIRKYKIDELPQLVNVLFGTMSLVGPRPEVRKYVDKYTDEQKEVLLVQPGITDYASLEYFSENELLAKSSDPEKTYLTEIMPAKLELNKKYIVEAGLVTDLKIIFRTIKRIFVSG